MAFLRRIAFIPFLVGTIAINLVIVALFAQFFLGWHPDWWPTWF